MSRLPRSTRRTIVVVMVLGIIGSACGARVPGAVRDQAANAVLKQGQPQSNQPGPGGVTPTQSPGATVTDNPSNPNNPSQPGTSAVPSSQGSAPSSGHTSATGPNPHSHSSKPAGSGCGSGTDVGLTNSAITLGGVADLTGPVSGLFAGARQGLVAFQAYANSVGGICGHQVQIQFGDSGTNCSQNQNATDNLVHKVFAFIGNFSLYDGIGCGGTVIKDNPTVPDISVAIDPSLSPLRNHYDFAPGPPGYGTGMFAYYRKKFGTKVQHVGTITENIPSVVAKQKTFVHAAETQGWKFVYQNAASPTTSNFSSNFQTACGRDHIQVFFTETVNAQYAATMLANERSVAACKGVINIMGIAYDSALFGYYQGNPKDLTVYGWTPNALFFNADEAKNIPEVALFQQWFRRTNPGQPLNLYAMYVWSAGRLLQQAIENAGPVLSRKTVLASLNKVKNFTDNGLLAPSTPSSKTVGDHCYLLFELSGGVFSRVDDPATGFRCDGKFEPLS